MATPAEVLQQAGSLSSGSRFERARAGATALRMFLDLEAEDKRSLAVLVAQKVAPELIPRIQAESGMDLTAEQSKAVLDMIGRLDGNDIDELAASVASPEARRAALGQVGTAAAAATGLDDVVAGPASAATTGTGASAAVAGAAGAAGAAAAATQSATVGAADDASMREHAAMAAQVSDLEARLAAAEATARTTSEQLERSEAALETATSQVEALEGRLRDAKSDATTTRRDHEGAMYELERRLQRAQREVEEAGGRSMSSQASSPIVASALASLPSFDDTTFAGEGDDVVAQPERPPMPRGPVSQHVGDLVATLRGAASGSAALRHVRAWGSQLRSSSADDRARVLEAIPDGWARRRALQRMVEDGITSDDDVSSLRLLARTSDQVFVAAAMLDTGIAYRDLAGHLAPAARTRLERRVTV